MALNVDEKIVLNKLIEAERSKQMIIEKAGDVPNPWWLIEKLEEEKLCSEALRLVQEARAAKQVEVDKWPVVAEVQLVKLQAQLETLISMELKLSKK